MAFVPPTIDGVGASRVALPPGDWISALDFLAERFPHIARAEWIERMQRGEVLNDAGEVLSPASPYKSQGVLFYYRHIRDEARIPFDEVVLYQDDLLVAVDKPHFLPVIARGRYVRETLLARLKRRLGIDTLAPLHRLDRETAGVMLFVVHEMHRDRYMQLFRERRISKIYEAIGMHYEEIMLPTTYRCRLEEGEHYMQMREVTGTANSESRIERIEVRGEWARYKLTPTTGKKHQLRAHMAALGIPIRNDRLYPTMAPYRNDDYENPLQLLAQSLEFIDPISNEPRRFETRQSLSFGASSARGF